MCTASWLVRPDGYELFFNRDELRRRAPAEPPRLWQRGSVRFLAPVDGEAGGTWIAANEFGLTVALLNLYGESAPAGSGDFVSRGRLVERLAVSASPALLRAQLVPETLRSFRPSTLLVLALEAPVWVGRWDGGQLTETTPDLPLLSSSGYDAAAAEAARHELWRRDVLAAPSAERLLAFHRSHLPERGPFSPCMHRNDARTVSFTHVSVSATTVSMRHAGGPPCSTPVGVPELLARRAESLVAQSPS